MWGGEQTTGPGGGAWAGGAAADGGGRCSPGATFPAASWTDRTAAVAAQRPEAIAALEAYAFPADLDWSARDRAGVRTNGVVVIQGGELIYERYANGFDPDTRHIGWSVSKTATALLAGVAVGEGSLALDDSICDHISPLPEANCAVRVRDLLDFGSGLDWLETYENEPLTSSSVLQMLYGDGAGDMARFVATHPRRDVPGSTYMYSSGDTNLLAGVLDAAMSSGHADSWPHDVLLDRIGASGATWERDGSGVIVGSSHLWATPRDFARLGLLLAEEGCWNGDQLVSADWVEQMASVQPPIQNAAWDRGHWSVQGRHVWLNEPLPERRLDALPWPQVPEGAYAARGHWGQSIVVVPSLDLVVVRTADDRTDRISLNRFTALAMAVAGVGPVPAEAPARSAATLRTRVPSRDRGYEAGVLPLGTGFAAKEACSCAFVMERSKAWCADWLRVRPDVARFRVDDEDRTVTARALGLARSEARYVDAQQGCVLVR